MSLDADYYLNDGPRGRVLRQWLRNTRNKGIGFGPELQDALIKADVPGCFAPADLDRWLLALERAGFIQRVKHASSFSRRALLGLESSSGAYPFDFSWEVPNDVTLPTGD